MRHTQCEQHIWDGRRNDVFNKSFISEILHSWFMSESCGVSYDMCSLSEEANKLIILSPLSLFILLCPKGVLQFSRHLRPNRFAAKQLGTATPMLERKAEMLLAMKISKMKSSTHLVIQYFYLCHCKRWEEPIWCFHSNIATWWVMTLGGAEA